MFVATGSVTFLGAGASSIFDPSKRLGPVGWDCWKSKSMSKTAGIVIIGNEVLSGKTQDINSYFFCSELRQLGVEVQKISTIQDDIELIGREAAEFSKRFDYVFTSGGVGPTHDDVTI